MAGSELGALSFRGMSDLSAPAGSGSRRVHETPARPSTPRSATRTTDAGGRFALHVWFSAG